MGRGYSASRSKNGRATLGLKRSRSASMVALKRKVEERTGTPAATDAAAVAPKDKRALLAKPSEDEDILHRTPATTKDGKASPRESSRVKAARAASKRGQSLVRYRLEEMEAELEDEMEASENERETVAISEVMVKYKTIGRLVDEVMELLAAACVVGANTQELCEMGDVELLSRLKKVFSKAKYPRGLSYPTNVSVNGTLCNHSPMRSDDAVVLCANDVVKIHLGCHLDGYPVSAARTIVVASPHSAVGDEESAAHTSSTTTEKANPLYTLEAAKAIEAARIALLGLVHLARPGARNVDLTDFIARVGQHFGVEAVEGVLSNRTKRWVPDGLEAIIGRRVTETAPQQDVGPCEMDEFQVWNLDVAFTNAPTFKVARAEETTTLFRRTPFDFAQDTRVQRANEVMEEITRRHHCFPFHPRHLTDPLRAKVGVSVLVRHGMVDSLPVLRTKGKTSITSRFSATIALTGKQVSVLCGLPSIDGLCFHGGLVAGSLPADLADILAQPPEYAKRSIASVKFCPHDDSEEEEEEEEEVPQRSAKRVRRG